MIEIGGVKIPISFEVTESKGNYILRVDQLLIKLMYFDKKTFETINPNVDYTINRLK